MHADVDGGRRHLACACGRGWGTWTPCVRADGLPVNADEYKEKTKKYLPCNGYRAHEHAVALRANTLACGRGRLKKQKKKAEKKKKKKETLLNINLGCAW